MLSKPKQRLISLINIIFLIAGIIAIGWCTGYLITQCHEYYINHQKRASPHSDIIKHREEGLGVLVRSYHN